MADSYDEEPISEATKIEMAADFLKFAPPGEFNEVYNDVATILHNENQMKEACRIAVPQWNVEQFLPVELGTGEKCLLTPAAALPNGRYYDPKSKQSFDYHHMQRAASDLQQIPTDEKSEPLRAEVEAAVEAYVNAHYPNGTTSVYGQSEASKITVIICIEDHEFQSRNHWGGRWRSCWTIEINDGQATISGLLRIQVHYYENGNVQLLCKKEYEHEMCYDRNQFVADLIKYVKTSEGDYQSAISDNYVKMSDTTFKALRRQLPMTKTKIDWHKLLGYRIGKEATQAANH
ncbi:Oidioi.mRNA.OKI2018_I69.XSR.g14390.t1.cds [Oikopleura dioica]|uniref:F-actin-capping protein subunit alpha n=1 Tax=Oikopleura dioica TaxID=34765 RepID=A0ABN7SGX1_OIKDI|nr:Oidioi.mRNA.OKI2018_I69.XSR.g14390.t1.cds [Oikopleura dioica]